MWNHRIFTKKINDRKYFCLKEAFYNDDGTVHSWTEDPLTGYFESVEELKSTHELMCKDISKYSTDDLILDEDELDKQFNEVL